MNNEADIVAEGRQHAQNLFNRGGAKEGDAIIALCDHMERLQELEPSAKRINVELLKAEIGMLNREVERLEALVEWHRVELAKQIEMTNTLGAKVERLQADQTILLATAQDALECLIDWASYADEYFLVKHDFKGDVQRISSVTDRFRRNLQTGDSNE